MLSVDEQLPAVVGGGGEFATALLVLGALLMFGALISGLVRRSFLSLTAVFVLAGFALGEGGAEVLSFDPEGGFVESLALVALVIILFRDGLDVEAEMLQREWHLPFRKLVLAMPLTAALVALVTRALLAARPRRGHPGRRADLQPCRAGRLLLDHRPRAVGHARGELDRAARRRAEGGRGRRNLTGPAAQAVGRSGGRALRRAAPPAPGASGTPRRPWFAAPRGT